MFTFHVSRAAVWCLTSVHEMADGFIVKNFLRDLKPWTTICVSECPHAVLSINYAVAPCLVSCMMAPISATAALRVKRHINLDFPAY